MVVSNHPDMPQKVRLTPLQRDILWLLEEAGEEDMLTVEVTLKRPDAESLNSAVAGLVHLGYVRQSESSGRASLVMTNQGRKALTT